MTGPPLGLEFRDMAETDLEDGLRLSRAAGWNQTLEDWRLLVSLGPSLFRLALRDGEVVASGGAVRYGTDLAWICMILVRPDQRGYGLGTRVFDDVLGRVRRFVEAGQLRAVGLDATPAGRRIYEQRGLTEGWHAEPAGLIGTGPELVRLRAKPGPVAVRAALPAGTAPLEAAQLPAVLARDRDVFGADRSPVLQRSLASAPELAWTTPSGAYCFGRHGDHSDHVGPIVADDPESARALVAACLSAARRRPLILDARAEAGWLAALAALGFRQERPFTRMYLGDARPASRPAAEPAVVGPEFG